MALEMRTGSINFDSTQTTAQAEEETVVFSNDVVSAQAMLAGYEITFTNGDVAHPFLRQGARVGVQNIEQNVVRVSGLISLSDGNGSDPMSGNINFVVLADVAEAA